LVKLKAASAKCGGATQQVVSPHPIKAFTIATLKLTPRAPEVFIPGKERAFVIGSKIVNVFENKKTLSRPRDLGSGGDQRVRENVSLDPWI
jgi:hypothetical protein